jgi:hypothetical protein
MILLSISGACSRSDQTAAVFVPFRIEHVAEACA